MWCRFCGAVSQLWCILRLQGHLRAAPDSASGLAAATVPNDSTRDSFQKGEAAAAVPVRCGQSEFAPLTRTCGYCERT